MPRSIERSTTIRVSPQAVFAYLADFPRHSEWADVPVTVEQVSSGPVGQGTTYRSVGHQLGRDFHAELTITEYAPGDRLAFEAKGDAFHFRHRFVLQEEDRGTRVRKQTEPVRLGFPFRLLTPLLRAFILPRGIQADLERIKARVEGS